MKRFILLFVLCTSLVTVTSASDPLSTEPCCPVVYETPEIELSYDVKQYSAFFEPAYFNEKTNALHFESYGKIQFVKVINSQGELQYQLPVMSNKVRLSKNMFESGEYQFQFQLEDESDALVTYVKIN